MIAYARFGGMRFTLYGASGLTNLVGNGPPLRWAHVILPARGFSRPLGVPEFSVGGPTATRFVDPASSIVGGLLSAGLFATTLSFLATTPGVAATDLGFAAKSRGSQLVPFVGRRAVGRFPLDRGGSGGGGARAPPMRGGRSNFAPIVRSELRPNPEGFPVKRIASADPATATGKAEGLLDGVKVKFGYDPFGRKTT